MLDLTFRALIHPVDYVGMFNHRTLTLLTVIQESATVYTFVFEPNSQFAWQAGQHGVFFIPKRISAGSQWRAFSIASFSAEKVIKISTIITDKPSDYKKELLLLKPGDKIKMHGPFGEFHLTKKIKNVIGVTGGIGVTPFRSILGEMSQQGLTDMKIHMLYGSNDGVYLYQNEFDSYQTNPNISINYLGQKEEVQEALLKLIKVVGNDAVYYLSGAPRMIIELRSVLKNNGIKRIVNDPFKGY